MSALRQVYERIRPEIRPFVACIHNVSPLVRQELPRPWAGWRPNVEKFAPTAVPLLRSALADSDIAVRIAAANALGEFGAAAQPAIPALAQLWRDRSPAVRDCAKDAIGKIRDDNPR